jgi:hypothetical protein
MFSILCELLPRVLIHRSGLMLQWLRLLLRALSSAVYWSKEKGKFIKSQKGSSCEGSEAFKQQLSIYGVRLKWNGNQSEAERMRQSEASA